MRRLTDIPYKAAFNKSDLAPILPAFDSVNGIITGTLQCNGAPGTMIAHATARVLKATTVNATGQAHHRRSAPTSFKDLNGNGPARSRTRTGGLPVAQRVEDLLSRMTLAGKGLG